MSGLWEYVRRMVLDVQEIHCCPVVPVAAPTLPHNDAEEARGPRHRVWRSAALDTSRSSPEAGVSHAAQSDTVLCHPIANELVAVVTRSKLW